MIFWRQIQFALFLLVLAVVTFSLAIQPTVSAISKGELQTILRNTAYYGDFGGTGTCGATTDSGAGAPLTGSGNQQKAFNYFKDKGLTDVESSAIVANLIAESGVSPRSNQGGGGPGRGIAQWSVDGRWAVLTKWAAGANRNPLELSTQLDYLWMELNGKPPAGDYSGAFKQFKDKASKGASNGFSQLQVATGFFMGTSAASTLDSDSSRFIAAFGKFGGFENPGTPHLDRRFLAAKTVYGSYGSGDSSATTADTPTSISGSDASCASAGAVDCNNGAAQSATGNLSQTRQNVVCLALQEVGLWDSGKKGPGSDYLLYTQGRNEEWCADFASWIYNKAGYPLDTKSKGGNVAAVKSVKGIGEAGGRFAYHAAGSYTPVPGDIVVYQNGESHVNIVVSVNANKKSFSVVGGNQDGSSTANSSSKVSQYALNGYSGGHITGFVSPKE